MHKAFDDLFIGVFETGVQPGQVSWQQGQSDPGLLRQICNGWKVSRDLVRVVLDDSIGKTIAEFSGWSGVCIMIDNVIWKAPATKSLGFHQDNSFLSWFDPGEIMTCWIALDDTKKEGGTIELACASHQRQPGQPEGQFQAPEDYRKPMCDAAARAGIEPEICYVEVEVEGGSFHHGRT
ncbi:MAG: phytanoyl-CoA hydroxylase [Gammaproteobacteria bacterium]